MKNNYKFKDVRPASFLILRGYSGSGRAIVKKSAPGMGAGKAWAIYLQFFVLPVA